MNENNTSNKIICTEDYKTFFVIEADKDSVRKYVKDYFSKNYRFTVVLKRAKRFNNKELAESYIKCVNNINDTIIENAEIKEVSCKFTIV